MNEPTDEDELFIAEIGPAYAADEPEDAGYGDEAEDEADEADGAEDVYGADADEADAADEADPADPADPPEARPDPPTPRGKARTAEPRPAAAKAPQTAPRAKAATKKVRRRAAASEPTVDLGSEKLYFKIGEVAQIVGVPAYVLRYWETEFKVIKPQKSRAQQRVYRRRDVETLLKIKHLLYAKRFTIAGARQQLRQGGDEVEMAAPASSYLAAQSLATVRAELDELIAWVAAAEEQQGSLAADPAAYLQAMGGARAMVDQAAAAGSAQPLLGRPGRDAL